MDWFEKLTGFSETSNSDTLAKLKVDGNRLHSLITGDSFVIGELELVSLEDLRVRLKSAGGPPGRLKARVVIGNVREMHRLPANAGALFQVASQFNLLEMIGPAITPEDGVTRYKDDPTQGPACAIAAGAATIYRNYFAPVGGTRGQTAKRQLDGLAGLGEALAGALKQPIDALWKMQNGYAQCTRAGLDAITKHLDAVSPKEADALRGKLCIGIHRDVEVTEAAGDPRPLVSQAFCSALPVAYSSNVPAPHWKAFGSLVLEAAYEATMVAGVLNAQRGASNIVLLTELGAGAFGNDPAWVHAAMRRALEMTSGFDLDVKLVSYRSPSRGLQRLAEDFG
jgi:hypothetical protein